MRFAHTAPRGILASAGIAVLALLASQPAVAQPADQPAQPAADQPAADQPPPAAAQPAQPAAGQPAQPGAAPAATPDQPEAGTEAATATGGPPTESTPINLRLRRLEQRVQSLKERAWRAKARVGMLKEAVLGGGVGASATLTFKNKMGGSYRLIKMVFALDGTQIFARSDDSGALHDTKSYDILSGPIAPGSHTISVLLLYRGHGYGVFKYLNKYKFTVRSSHTFTVGEGKSTAIDVVGFEKGGVTTPLDKRPAVDFKVTLTKGGAQ